MSRRLALLLVLAIWPTSTWAQGVDWRTAGGSLFARRSLEEPETLAGGLGPGEAAGNEVRVADPVQPYAVEVAQAAGRHGLDPKLLHAVVVVESAYHSDAVSPAGAQGLVQLMPATAEQMGVRDRRNVSQNLEGGSRYLAAQINKFGDLRLALAAYNAGPARVARLGRVPTIPETQAYVDAVVDCYLALTAGRSIRFSRTCRLAAREQSSGRR